MGNGVIRSGSPREWRLEVGPLSLRPLLHRFISSVFRFRTQSLFRISPPHTRTQLQLRRWPILAPSLDANNDCCRRNNDCCRGCSRNPSGLTGANIDLWPCHVTPRSVLSPQAEFTAKTVPLPSAFLRCLNLNHEGGPWPLPKGRFEWTSPSTAQASRLPVSLPPCFASLYPNIGQVSRLNPL
jgi:hypothetical protein